MSDLRGKQIREGYKFLLGLSAHTSAGAALGLESTLRFVTDGNGVRSPLKLGTNSVGVDGVLIVSGEANFKNISINTFVVSGNSSEIRGVSPRLKFTNTSAGTHDYWALNSNNNFYITVDTNKDGSWESNHPLRLDSNNSKGYIFGGEVLTLGSSTLNNFVRTDTDSTKTSGYINFNDSTGIRLGTGNDDSIYHNGTHTYWNHNTGNLYLTMGNDTDFFIRDENNSSVNRFTFDVDPGNLTVANRITAGEHVFCNHVNMTHGVSTRNTDTVFFSGTTDGYVRKNTSSGIIASLDLDNRYARTGVSTIFNEDVTLGNSKIREYTSSETPITSQVPGTASGTIIESPINAHIVIGIRGNDNNDGFHVVGNNASNSNYDRSLLRITNGGIFRAPNASNVASDPKDILTKERADALYSSASGSGPTGNALLLNSLSSNQFLRSDVTAQKTGGNLVLNDNISLSLGTNQNTKFMFNGANTIITQNTGGMYIDMVNNNNLVIRDVNNNYDQKLVLYTDAGRLDVSGDIRSTMYRNSVDTNNYFAQGSIQLRSAGPIIYLRDTDGRSTALHCNNNTFYIGRSSVNDTVTMAAWPLQINLTNGNVLVEGTLTAGGYAGNGSGLSNVNAATLGGAAKNTATVANTIVQRDGSGDIHARLFRSEYDSTNGNIGYIMTQIDTVSNNYIRPSTPDQVALGLHDKFTKLRTAGGNGSQTNTLYGNDTGNAGMYFGTNIVYFSVGGLQAARIDLPGTNAPGTNTIITREKGDARYAGISTSSNNALLNYSIGSHVLVLAAGQIPRNEARTLYLNSGTGHYTTSVTPQVLEGTWRARGGSRGDSGSAVLFQRVA